MKEHIETLAKKATDAHDAGDAMKLAQAALNLSNTLANLHYVQVEQEAKQAKVPAA